MAIYGGQYTITATATSLTTILAAADAKFPAGGTFIKELLLQATTAANPCYIGRSNVTNAPANAFGCVDSQATTRFPVRFGSGNGAYFTHTDDIYVVGSAADTLFVSVIT